LEELFVRYWENALSAAESAEFHRLLATDPQARERFQNYCLQGVVAAELPALAARNELGKLDFASPPERISPPWSRRQILGYLGGGTAALALLSLVGREQMALRNSSLSGVKVSATKGEVTLSTARGTNIRPEGDIPSGGTLTTFGPTSSALLSCSDGSQLFFAGDSEVAVVGATPRLVLLRGAATAHVPRRMAGLPAMVLQTAHATLTRMSNVLMTMSRNESRTEVGVQNGMVSVDSLTGQSLGIVRAGELLTVRADGDRSKQATPTAPYEFAWDLRQPLPSGWKVGQREETADGPVVVPEMWLDPYYQVEMCQIRSDHQWTRGFFRLLPDSTIRVRYWVDQPGPSQVVICVRTSSHSEPSTGVLECNDAFAEAKPETWQTLEIKAGEMLANGHEPKFRAPWVGFLIIFNSYRSDIGLKIAEFEVLGPGRKPQII